MSMLVLFVVVSALVLIGLCAWVWWWSTTRLAYQERTAVFDINEAADYVASGLPDEVAERLDRDTVIRIIDRKLAYLRQAGMATFGGVDEVAMQAANQGKTVIADSDSQLDYVLSDFARRGEPIEAVDVAVVLDGSNRYLDAIGALGPSAPLPES